MVDWYVAVGLYNILKARQLLPEPEEYDAEERDNMLRELATLMLMVKTYIDV